MTNQTSSCCGAESKIVGRNGIEVQYQCQKCYSVCLDRWDSHSQCLRNPQPPASKGGEYHATPLEVVDPSTMPQMDVQGRLLCKCPECGKEFTKPSKGEGWKKELQKFIDKGLFFNQLTGELAYYKLEPFIQAAIDEAVEVEKEKTRCKCINPSHIH